MPAIFSKKYGYVLIVLPVTLLWILLVNRGLTFTYDSYNFLCGAISFRQNFELLMCDNSTMTLSPPGYSIFLSLFLDGTNKVSKVFTFFTLLCYGATMFCWLQIIKQEIEDKRHVLFALLQIGLALPLFYIHLFVWSEGVFMLLFSLGVFYLVAYKREYHLKWLLLSCIAFGLSVIFRYAGFTLYFLIISGLLLTSKRFGWIHYAVMGIPFFVIGILLLRNFNLDHNVLGHRPFSNRSFLKIAQTCITVITNWLLPAGYFWWSVYVFSLIGLISVVKLGTKSLIFWIVPFLGYFVFIVFSAYSTDIEYDERLFVPVFPFFLLIIFKLLPQLPKNKYLDHCITFLLAGWTFYSFLRLSKNVFMWVN